MSETAMFQQPITATPRIVIERLPGEAGPILCNLVWDVEEGIDRTDGYGIQLPFYQMELARRYQKAVGDGKIFSNPRRAVNDLRQTYVVCDGFVMGKYLDNDLQEIGY